MSKQRNTFRHEALARVMADYLVDVAQRSETLRMISAVLVGDGSRPGLDDVVFESWRTAVEETAAHHIAAVIDLASVHGCDLNAIMSPDDSAVIRDAVEILRDREGTS